MKNFYRLFSSFTMAFFFALSLQLNAQIQSKVAVVSNINQNSRADYVFNLPFIEDWEYHTFTHNLWETSDDDWAIDVYNGNDGASAMFQGSSNQTNYSSTLTSNWLSGSAVGKDTLRFDLKLSDLAANGTEFFFIKIFDGTTYHTIDSIANNGSFDWTNYTYVITDATAGNDFKVVFEASGSASSNILDWHIDNIEVSRGCDPPTDLNGEFIVDENEIYCSITWDTPDFLIPIGPWEHWDSGENFTGIGLNTGNNFSVAARWEAGSFGVKDGDTISKIKYFLADNQFDNIVLHIWTGENAANIIYSDTITNPIAGMWNVVNINSTIILDASLEYWVGYDIINQVAGTFPAGTDAGPAIAGFGDKISTDGGNTWENLSGFGLNYNWNVEMYVEHAPPADSTLKMFVVYRSVEGEDYQSLDTVDYVIGQLNFEYQDYNINYEKAYNYKVNAVWTKEGDTCVSPFARRMDLPIFDYITILTYIGLDENQTNSKLTLYPNPATSTITVDAENELTNIIVYDLTGKEVLKTNPLNGNKVSINIASLQSGIYLIKAKTASGVLFRKFVKQ